MANDVLELVGFMFFLAFWAVVWWPAVLLSLAVGLITAAIVRERSAARRPEVVDELRRKRARAELEKLGVA